MGGADGFIHIRLTKVQFPANEESSLWFSPGADAFIKQLEDPGVRETFQDVVDIEDFLARYRRSPIEFLGTGLAG